MKTTTISVTAKDIAEANKRLVDGMQRICNCPVSLAIERKTGKRTSVCFFALGAYISISELPRKAQDFIEDFDLGKPVKPFSFKLDI